MRFEKGNKMSPGRPEGSKNKNCMMPVFWYNLIEEKSKNLPDKEVIEIAFRALNLLMPKVLVIPATPNDSVNNATLMAAVEARARALPTGPIITPDTQGLDSSGVNNGDGVKGNGND